MYQHYTFILLFLSCCLSDLGANGQSLNPVNPTVIKNGQELSHSFAGGINSAQYQELDIDEDGDFDLVVFDRSSDKINCFENFGDHYEYNLFFETVFPNGIQNWMVLKDYDCDGKNDLFTSSNSGIAVYQNIATSEGISWELIVEPLLTESTDGSLTNLFLNATDIPSIEDLDSDGDLDILVFDFVSGINIELHENISDNNCDLDFKKTNDNYGGINLLDCSFITFDSELSASRILHLGGKALLSIDMNSDGVMDLAISEENCDDISYMENQGSIEMATFDSFLPFFPTQTSSVNFNFFPTPYHIDVTFDGNKDILVSSNYRDNPQSNIDFDNTSFLYVNEGSNDFSTAQNFLQNEMIDVGSWAYPALVDINNDGLNDIVIGNEGSFIDDRYVSSLTYFEATSSGNFEEVDTDLFGLSELHYTYIRPQFVHVDNDGVMDLVFTALNDRFSQKLYYILGVLSNDQVQYNSESVIEVSISYSFGDCVYLYDLDSDSDLDALVGRTYGELDFFENVGNFEFTLNTQNILEGQADTESGNINVSIGDVDSDGTDDLVLTERSGKTKIYHDFKQNKTVFDESLLTEVSTSTRFGRASFPAVGLLRSQSLIIGSIQGGLRLFEFSSNESESLTLETYPNPSIDREMGFRANQDCLLSIYSPSGLLVVSEVSLTKSTLTKLDFKGIDSGLYIAYIQNSEGRTSNKIIISNL